MTGRTEKLKAASPQVRAEALALLDDISVPMNVRELDDALFPYLGATNRRAAVNALKQLHIIAIIPRPDAFERP